MERRKMRMLLVGAGAVGESILKILKWRDPEGTFLEYVLVSDFNMARAEEVCRILNSETKDVYRMNSRAQGITFVPVQLDATDKDRMKELICEDNITFVMDAAPPFASNYIFDAAYEAGADYASMGTWSVPMEEPKLGLGIENSYTEPMTKYNFDRHQAWKDKGQCAAICLGIDPGVVNVFAKFAALHLLDTLEEVHVKDGGDLTVPNGEPDAVLFGFNVWTVMDEVMNPNVEYNEERGGFLVEEAFAGKEVFRMPEGVGDNTLVKVEHEETVTMPRFLKQYGLKRASFKISLDENLIQALKLLDRLGLRSLKPINVRGNMVVPRDVVAACAPQPKDIGDEMVGRMMVGVHCKGIKDGVHKEYFIYQPFDNQTSIYDWNCQAVTMQTGWGAALAIELLAKGIWKDAGVYSPEYFDPDPFMELMKETGYRFGIEEKTP